MAWNGENDKKWLFFVKNILLVWGLPVLTLQQRNERCSLKQFKVMMSYYSSMMLTQITYNWDITCNWDKLMQITCKCGMQSQKTYIKMY